MPDHHGPPNDTLRQRGRISSFVLRLRTQKNKSKTACPLHKLPPELREEIFKPLLVNWNGKTPSLIKALRPDKTLYSEALEIFYKHSRFIFHRENDWSFGDMTKEAVPSIGRVKIVVESEIMKRGLWKIGGSKNAESLLTPMIPASLSDAANIREVILEFKGGENIMNDNFLPLFVTYGNTAYSSNYFLLSFQKLSRVELSVPQPYFTQGDWFPLYYDRERKYFDGIKMANDRLGVPAKLSTVPALQIREGDWKEEDEQQAINAREEWFWQAEEGSFLKEPRVPATK